MLIAITLTIVSYKPDDGGDLEFEAVLSSIFSMMAFDLAPFVYVLLVFDGAPFSQVGGTMSQMLSRMTGLRSLFFGLLTSGLLPVLPLASLHKAKEPMLEYKPPLPVKAEEPSRSIPPATAERPLVIPLPKARLFELPEVPEFRPLGPMFLKVGGRFRRKVEAVSEVVV